MEHAHDPVLPFVEALLAREDITPTAFGRLAIGDPRLVPDLRNGRELRRLTRERVFSFITNFASSPCPPTRAKRAAKEVVNA
ncbi:hypothetical protein JK207_07660 [Gluconobacter cerinus]|uniref:hypothetical protein n=1 Tax=Gluconobacter cerinus TaxID=38307 RepID=UPI001B8D281F|nr:hypothetical protein [Gluconobacter cerinus]MBS1021907.1 hypothetical protein [Gluconobacter cerinus]